MKNILKASLAISAISVAISAVLVACGGSNSGTPNSPIAKLRMVPSLDKVDAPVGGGWYEVAQIHGGTRPYDFTNSVVGMSVRMDDGDRLMVRANSAKEENGEITVYDNSLPVQQVTIKGSTRAVPMSSSAGTVINLPPNESRTFNVMGGIGPYTIANPDTNVATARISGSTVTVTAKPVTTTRTATVKVIDAAGAALEITVNVQTAPSLDVSPAVINSSLRTTSRTIAVSGGMPPYRVAMTNRAVATATVAGSTITVNLNAQGTTDIIVMDSASSTPIRIQVTVNNKTIDVQPNSRSINEDDPSTIISYRITGGTSPYAAMISSADKSYIEVLINNTDVLSVYKISCVSEDRDIPIDVYDANWEKQTVHLIIKNNITDPKPSSPTNCLTAPAASR